MGGMVLRSLSIPGNLYTDDANRTTEPLTAPWVNKVNASSPGVTNNQIGFFTGSNGFQESVYDLPLAADHFAEFRISTLNVAAVPIALLLGCSNTSNTHAAMFINANQVGIYTATAWGGGSLTVRAGYVASGTKAVGDVFQFWRLGRVYSAARNGVVYRTWTDSSAIVPIAHVRAGLAVQKNGSGVSSYVDDFRCGDYTRLGG